ncbi:glycosyl hydrolase-related protein [Paenibacillus sp. HWE-109]|uniref:alpha-mannosidase n=1 Tax=Paenibacillus sp. HWE-109 TaxID=1306526 RepID=UPI001EDE9705|nr:glycoside hydrolase family 38 C-terminal domain-containing protein [Paenibacillus sp. HWE-109]UKS28312.1 glycosyl hydrolase-related protein [Paenibacillus sp. HWE-109]
MPYETIKLERLKATLNKIQKHIYLPVASLEVTAFVTKEPVVFDLRDSGQFIELSPGDKWGELWDCAWFHFCGVIPELAAGQKVVLLIDVNGELCLVDHEGTPVQGLTNVNSEFEISLGLPGKRVVHVSSNATGDEVIDIWADAGCNDLFGYYRSGTLKEADIAICYEETRKLYFDFEVLLELVEHLPEQSSRRIRVQQALYEVALLLAEMTEENISAARRILEPELLKKGGDPSLSVSAIGHAHMDLAWLWPIRETIRKGARTFSTALRMMEQYPDYVFGASQPQLYVWMKEFYPKLYEQIKVRIEEGRWEVQGAMWVEPDSNIAGGETLARQILYGKRFFLNEFNKEMQILWVPDIFGYSACLPQLLKLSGVPYMVTQKLSWNVYNDHPHHTFMWEGLDGSKVLTHLPPEDTYNSPAAPRSIIKAEKDYLDKNISDICLMLFGIGDGGGGPGEEHLERLQREKNLQGLLPVKQEPALNFFEKLNIQKERYKTWRGELYLEKHQGTLTSQARNKRYNRKIEKALRELEFAASLNLSLGGTYPAEELEKIWKEVLLYQFHDILPGSSITRVYDESLERYEVLLSRIEELVKQHYERLADGVSVSSIAKPVVIFNSLPWVRKQWLQIQDRWVYTATPSMGYQVVDAAGIVLSESLEIKSASHLMENELLRVGLNHDGTIYSIYDKSLNKEMIAAGARANVLSIYPDNGDAWDFPTDYAETKATEMKLIEVQAYVNGPQAIIEQTYHYGKSTLHQKIILTSRSKRLDFETMVDWQEDERMLRASFPVQVYTDNVNCDIQFGHIKRQTHRNTSWDRAKDEICAHQWIDLSQSDYGVALLNDCKYGFKADGNVLDINLLRSPSSPDPECDRAQHEFIYSLFPHEGDFVQAQVYKEGYELNVPLRVVDVASNNGVGPQSESFFCMDSPYVMIEAVKKAEDSNDIIVRLYETSGRSVITNLQVKLPFTTVSLVDLMERELCAIALDNETIKLSFTPFEIKTIQLSGRV